MIPYQKLLDELNSFADEKYREFNKRLLKNQNINVIGVRVPVLRKIARKYRAEVDGLLDLPSEFYEVNFVKLVAVSFLQYDEMTARLGKCMPLLDNWASCDSFAPACIKEHREDFLLYIDNFLSSGKEFYQRFALTTLLHFYVSEEYLSFIFSAAEKCDKTFYYAHMAAAWLIAETLVYYFDETVCFLKRGTLGRVTHNKAIQKACESYRLTDEQKKFLKGLKI